MASAKGRRIAKEIREAASDPLSRITIEMVQDDVNNLRGTIPGPPDTPYEGGTFVVEIKIPSEYPFRPPKMRFETKVWHPNVSSQTGAICIDTLSTGWSPILTIKSALMMLQSLLASPEPKDPQDAEVASMMLKKPQEFEHKAREWAVIHAGAPRKDIGEPSGGVTAQEILSSRLAAKKAETKENLEQYKGYNRELIGRFVAMGFDVPQVVSAFEYVGIDRMDGMDYELEEEYMGDITARLFGEA